VDGKGYLVVELPGGTPVFRPIGPTRRFVDLETIDAAGLGAAALDQLLADRVMAVAIDGAVVRLVVRNVTREIRAGLDYTAHRAWKAQALHFQLELRRSESSATPATRAVRHQRLEDVLAEFLGERPLPSDVPRAAFVDQGAAYFAAAGLDPTMDPYTGGPAGHGALITDGVKA
jgi:hypothetical protein